MSRFIARPAAILFALLLALLASQAAYAHAQLLSTEPAANAIVADSPDTLRLVFNEPVSPLVVTLIAPDGTSRDLLDVTTGGAAMLVHLPDALGEGTHVLSWRIVSADAHPIAGSLVFSIGTASGTTAAEAPAASRATAMALWATKSLLFAGLLFGIGAAVFGLAAPLPRPARRLALLLCLLGLVLTPLSLGLHGLDALGLAPHALVSPAPWTAGFSTSYGMTVLAAMLAFAAATAALALPGAAIAAWPAWALAALALALSGHAGAAAPQWLTRTSVTLHIGGLLFWIGALLPLLLWLRQRHDQADLALARFSRFVPLAVTAILLSGLVLATIQLGPPGLAWLSAYGSVLAAKLVLVALLLALAMWNRLFLTAPALQGEALARYRLRRSILGEIALVLLILLLASAWRFTPPPRAIALADAAPAQAIQPLYAHAMDDKVMADITITPGRAGPVALAILVTDATGAPLEPLALDITLSAPSLGIEPFKATATLVDGLWRIEDLTIPLPGIWAITLDIRISRFDVSRIATEITFT